MGFRARKSFKVAPGVRLNVSRSGVGASVGTRGARYSVHSSGRTTKSVGIPGTGLGYVSTSGGGRSNRATGAPRTAVPAPAPAPVKPGTFAPAGEKALYRLIKGGDYTSQQLESIAAQHRQQWLPAATIDALMRVQRGDTSDSTVGLLRALVEHPNDAASDPFIMKYLSVEMTIGLAPGVSVTLPASRDLLGLALAEVLQARGDLDGAIDIVERLTPTSYAAVSLAELYAETGRSDEVLSLTNGLTNEDDSTALLLVYRGIAFTRQQMFEAAREAFKEALKSKKRAPEIRHLALRQRAEAQAADGKRAMARKDLERILAEDSQAPGVRQRLAELSG